mmetsp:Transcript_89278/g.154634  ORF Transcript_89278/g.154634 Transcript_89278/m.154634 type:complete len:124 (-) Transcript_89278:365-736(-)
MGCVSAAGEPLIPVFKPVKTYFHKLQHASIQMNERLCAHTLFVRNITIAWVQAMKKECILNAWSACGLVPFNPQYLTKPNLTSPPESNEFVTSRHSPWGLAGCQRATKTSSADQLSDVVPSQG